MLLLIIPTGVATYYGNALSRRYHDQIWQLLGLGAFALIEVFAWLYNRARKQFRCRQCQTLLQRDDIATQPKVDARNLKFTCTKCDITWDASLPKPPQRY